MKKVDNTVCEIIAAYRQATLHILNDAVELASLRSAHSTTSDLGFPLMSGAELPSLRSGKATPHIRGFAEFEKFFRLRRKLFQTLQIPESVLFHEKKINEYRNRKY